MDEVEARLRECQLAQVPGEVEKRIFDVRRPNKRPNWSRRFWIGIAASLFVIWMANLRLDQAYDMSPYTSVVATREPVDPVQLKEYEAELAELLGDAGRDYLAYLRGQVLTTGEENGG